MGLDSAVDTRAAALGALAHAAANYDLSSTLGDDKAIVSLSQVPLTSAVYGSTGLPALSVWRTDMEFANRTMHLTSEQEWEWVFQYVPPAPVNDSFNSRRALLYLVWDSVLSALCAGQHSALVDGAGNPITLTSVGFTDLDRNSVSCKSSKDPAHPWFQATAKLTHRTPPDTSALALLTDIYFNLVLKPDVQDAANVPLVQAHSS